MSIADAKTTDTIPRASIAQILGTLGHLATVEKADFESVRRFLYSSSGRRVPASQTALWTVARDVLTELQRLGLAKVGALPRRRPDIDRLRESPCEITDAGADLAHVHIAKSGQAYDTLVLAWLNSHPYFRELISHILASRLYVPDVTSAAQVGDNRAVDELSSFVLRDCLDRLASVDFAPSKIATFEQSVHRRVADIGKYLASPDIDSKKLVDLVQDSVVIPAFLEAEQLAFDPVTFQHLLKITGEFYAAAATTSHPKFNGRVVFSTCDFTPNPAEDSVGTIQSVQHHGTAFARARFAASLAAAYIQVAGTSGGYADAYVLRAIVCVELRVQPPVFATCLKEVISAGDDADPIIYTELPFTPPPQGEAYVEVGGRRIGRLKIKSNHGV
jgi:hypothetical protein